MEAGFRRLVTVLFVGGVALLLLVLLWLNGWQIETLNSGQLVAFLRIVAGWWVATYGLFYAGRWVARGFKKGAR